MRVCALCRDVVEGWVWMCLCVDVRVVGSVRDVVRTFWGWDFLFLFMNLFLFTVFLFLSYFYCAYTIIMSNNITPTISIHNNLIKLPLVSIKNPLILLPVFSLQMPNIFPIHFLTRLQFLTQLFHNILKLINFFLFNS